MQYAIISIFGTSKLQLPFTDQARLRHRRPGPNYVQNVSIIHCSDLILLKRNVSARATCDKSNRWTDASSVGLGCLHFHVDYTRTFTITSQEILQQSSHHNLYPTSTTSFVKGLLPPPSLWDNQLTHDGNVESI